MWLSAIPTPIETPMPAVPLAPTARDAATIVDTMDELAAASSVTAPGAATVPAASTELSAIHAFADPVTSLRAYAPAPETATPAGAADADCDGCRDRECVDGRTRDLAGPAGGEGDEEDVGA